MNLINNAKQKTQITEEYIQHDSTHKLQKLATLNNILFGMYTNYKAKLGNEQNSGF